MEVLRINPTSPQPEMIARAADVVRKNIPFAFPTDTVYGVGMAVTVGGSPKPLFALKGRDCDKAIPWLVADAYALEEYGEGVPSYAFDLARAHWPGALTLVVRASATVAPSFTAADGTLALRAPAHAIPLALIKTLGVPLATTSANLQGGEPAASCASLAPQLIARLVLAIDGGPTPGILPSTIVSCLEERPRLLREGALPFASLLRGTHLSHFC
ncbi:MAG: threonylcarbamoyl-AMP synthase [Coriobacteriales bacterium]|jgi:tRNA threonylcarbamoyl adenosine modification protein (Sua5/YciO/YrdC/YwlC family)|nr:threonylcarbamoyl-AMP synthase [Coriobacteriales bacterium]